MSGNSSCRESLEWINDMVKKNYRNVEELCSGIAYCQIIESLFPGSIGTKQIKIPARFTHEKIINLKLLQGALCRLEVEKVVPIDKLVKGRFLDNYHFLIWFKQFYDSQGAVGNDNYYDDNSDEQRKPVAYIIPSLCTEEGENSKSLARGVVKSGEILEWRNSEEGQMIHDEILAMTKLNEIYDDLMNKLDQAEWDRNEAYNKLRKIELVLNKSIERGLQIPLCHYFMDAIHEGHATYSSSTIFKNS